MEKFTVEETNLMSFYDTGTRTGRIAALAAMSGHLEPDETELAELTRPSRESSPP